MVEHLGVRDGCALRCTRWWNKVKYTTIRRALLSVTLNSYSSGEAPRTYSDEAPGTRSGEVPGTVLVRRPGPVLVRRTGPIQVRHP